MSEKVFTGLQLKEVWHVLTKYMFPEKKTQTYARYIDGNIAIINGYTSLLASKKTGIFFDADVYGIPKNLKSLSLWYQYIYSTTDDQSMTDVIRNITVALINEGKYIELEWFLERIPKSSFDLDDCNIRLYDKTYLGSTLLHIFSVLHKFGFLLCQGRSFWSVLRCCCLEEIIEYEKKYGIEDRLWSMDKSIQEVFLTGDITKILYLFDRIKKLGQFETLTIVPITVCYSHYDIVFWLLRNRELTQHVIDFSKIDFQIVEPPTEQNLVDENKTVVLILKSVFRDEHAREKFIKKVLWKAAYHERTTLVENILKNITEYERKNFIVQASIEFPHIVSKLCTFEYKITKILTDYYEKYSTGNDKFSIKNNRIIENISSPNPISMRYIFMKIFEERPNLQDIETKLTTLFAGISFYVNHKNISKDIFEVQFISFLKFLKRQGVYHHKRDYLWTFAQCKMYKVILWMYPHLISEILSHFRLTYDKEYVITELRKKIEEFDTLPLMFLLCIRSKSDDHSVIKNPEDLPALKSAKFLQDLFPNHRLFTLKTIEIINSLTIS